VFFGTCRFLVIAGTIFILSTVFENCIKHGIIRIVNAYAMRTILSDLEERLDDRKMTSLLHGFDFIQPIDSQISNLT
jgi:hypothetical protein